MSANLTSRCCMLRYKELLAVKVNAYRYNHFWTYTLSSPTQSLGLYPKRARDVCCLILSLWVHMKMMKGSKAKCKTISAWSSQVISDEGGNMPPYTWRASCRAGTSSIWVIRSHKPVCVEEKVCFITYLSAWQCIKNWIRVDNSTWLVSTALSYAYIYTGCKHACQSLI